MRRRGFTIVELLISIAVLAVLMTIVTIAATGVIRNTREQRAKAMAKALEGAINSYYAQFEHWPSPIEEIAEKTTQEASILLDPDQTDQVFREIVKTCFGSGSSGTKSELIDPTALFVADTANLRSANGGWGCYDSHNDALLIHCDNGGRRCCRGVDFAEVVKRGSRYHIQLNSMSFGYQGSTNGRFCRFKIRYVPSSDSVSVRLTKDRD